MVDDKKENLFALEQVLEDSGYRLLDPDVLKQKIAYALQLSKLESLTKNLQQ